MRSTRSTPDSSAVRSDFQSAQITEKNLLLLAVVLTLGGLFVGSSMQWLLAAVSYWQQADISYAAFGGHESYLNLSFSQESSYHDLIGILLIVGGVLPLMALSALSSRYLGSTFSFATNALFRMTAFTLLLFAGLYIILHMFYGGAGQHAGQTALTIHSGTTFSVISIFVVYRLFESYATGNRYKILFQNQLAILALGPWLYQAAAGIWFMLFEHQYDHSYGQQLFVAFGHFLIPLLAAYALYGFGSSLISTSKSRVILLVSMVSLVGFGQYFYLMSNFQPSIF